VPTCESEPAAGGYTENGIVVAKIGDRYVWSERLDAATDLPTLDAPAPSVPEPDGGWPRGTVMAGGRPVRPLDPRWRSRSPQRSRSAGRTVVVGRTPRRGTRPRERRGRSARRTRSPSRDGPSDSSEGDGEGPPPPVSDDLLVGPPRVVAAVPSDVAGVAS
jgi:hypothetical protein